MFNPTALEKAIQEIEATMPDSRAGRIMRAAYRPFMTQFVKEIDAQPHIDGDIVYQLFQGVAKTVANMMTTVVRSTNNPDMPLSAEKMLSALIDMIDEELVHNMQASYDPAYAKFIRSYDETLQ